MKVSANFVMASGNSYCGPCLLIEEEFVGGKFLRIVFIVGDEGKDVNI